MAKFYMTYGSRPTGIHVIALPGHCGAHSRRMRACQAVLREEGFR